MATFNSIDIFGVHLIMTPVQAPKARELIGFAGVNGLFAIDLGTRGGQTHVEGWLTGATVSDVVSAESAFRTFQSNGGAFTLVDNAGVTWSNVILDTFAPSPGFREVIDVANGFTGMGRHYTATFLHLS